MTDLKIAIGGEGETVEIPLVVSGCSCRAEDFTLALVKFANEWKRETDRRSPPKSGSVKPCGCKDAQ